MSQIISTVPSNQTIDASEEKILISFIVLYKTARIIEKDNATFIKQADALFEKVNLFINNYGECTIKLISDRFFINENLVRLKGTNLSGSESVKAEWDLLSVGGVQFDDGLNQEELSKFFNVITEMKPQQDNVDSLSEKLRLLELKNIHLFSQITIDPDKELEEEEKRKGFRIAARKTFFQAVDVVQDVIFNRDLDQDINVSKTKRVVHSVIDQVIEDESSLVELASIKNFDDYTYAHSTNVTIYSLTLGVRLGLDRTRLSQLGFAALFHDIGKVKLDVDLIQKPDAFDEDDWIQMQQHPHLGAKTILRNMKFEPHLARAARGAFEHHRNDDGTGYPVLRYKKVTSNLFSKIIAIADTFDALTSGRVYIKKQIAPEEVIKKMKYKMKEKYDRFLLKLFSNIIGLYPVGSLVLMTTDELALVLTTNKIDKSRPYVKIIGNKEGFIDEPIWVDLAADDNKHRTIVRIIEPERYGLDAKDFILND